MNQININLVNKATVSKMKFEEKFKMVRDGLQYTTVYLVKDIKRKYEE